MVETKYSLRDMAKFFAPADRELVRSYKINEYNLWAPDKNMIVATVDGSKIANDGKRVEMILNGTFEYRSSSKPIISFQIGSYKSSTTILTQDKGDTFNMKCIIPASATINESTIKINTDNLSNGYVDLVDITLSVYQLNESSQTTLNTITGCLTTIANWIRKQN